MKKLLLPMIIPLVALLCTSGSAATAKDAESGKRFPPMPVLAPGALTAYGANGRAYLNWNPAIEDERVTGWQVYRSTDRKTWTRVTDKSISMPHFVDEKLDPAANYFYVVAAITSLGEDQRRSNLVAVSPRAVEDPKIIEGAMLTGADGIWPNFSVDVAGLSGRSLVETFEYLYASEPKAGAPQHDSNARMQFSRRISEHYQLQTGFVGTAFAQCGGLDGPIQKAGGSLEKAADFIAKEYGDYGVGTVEFDFTTRFSSPYSVPAEYRLDENFGVNPQIARYASKLRERGIRSSYWMRPEFVKTSPQNAFSKEGFIMRYWGYRPITPKFRHALYQVYGTIDISGHLASEVEPENQKKLIAFHKQLLAKRGEPHSLRFVNLRRGDPVTLLLKTGSVLAAGEAERIKETEKTETLVPWLYDGVIWQYADGREVRYPGYEDIIAEATR